MSFVSNNIVLTHQPIPIDKSRMISVDSHALAMKNENEIPSNDDMCNKDQIINQVWTKETFNSHEEVIQRKNYLKANLSLNLKPLKTTWTINKDDVEECDDGGDDEETDEMEFKANAKESSSPTCETPEKETASPSHHARRPMNAFLIFCKKHRPIVRQRFPHLENRGVTRILGEWWALLDATEKVSYTSLAKEYKDAFFSANPDFKWYKLPAPPLRTLNTRPVGVPKPSSPLASPTLVTTNNAEFTPGKLADETQLGNLTSLMSCGNGGGVNSFGYSDAKDSKSNSFVNNNNNNNNVENESDQHKQLLSPICAVAVDSEAPKPIKKRKFEENFDYDNKEVDFSVQEDDISLELSDLEQNHDEKLNGIDKSKQENITQQELMNKVVDSMFPDNMDLQSVINKHGWKKSKQKSKETRKSGRSCKGKRYAEFMVEGKLLGNKQIKKISQYKVDVNNKFDNVLNSKIENMMHNKNENQTPKLDLGDMIKRLAERTNIKLEDINEEEEGGLQNGDRPRTQSENSEDSLIKSQSNFNLDLRIAELPCLSYEMFLQRKKESKKRKPIRSKSESHISKTKVAKLCESNFLVGSKKRKNKNSITRLEKPRDVNYLSNFNNDLFGLATLAEVAANTEKIN